MLGQDVPYELKWDLSKKLDYILDVANITASGETRNGECLTHTSAH